MSSTCVRNGTMSSGDRRGTIYWSIALAQLTDGQMQVINLVATGTCQLPDLGQLPETPRAITPRSPVPIPIPQLETPVSKSRDRRVI